MSEKGFIRSSNVISPSCELPSMSNDTDITMVQYVAMHWVHLGCCIHMNDICCA